MSESARKTRTGETREICSLGGRKKLFFDWFHKKNSNFCFRFGLNSASRNGLIERQLLVNNTSTMAKRTKSARKAAKSVRRTNFLRAKNDSLSHLLLPFFFARQNMFIYVYISRYINLDSPNSKGFPSPNSLLDSLSLSPRGD